MKNDKDSIFEAYTQTLTEGWEAGTSKAPKGKSFDMSKGGAPSGVDAASDGSGGRYRKTRPPSAQSNKTHGEMEEDNLDNTSLEELSILSPEEYEMVQNFENFDADDWGYNKLQKFYFRKREGGEDNESREKSIMRGREAASAEQEIFYKEHGADAFEDHYGFEYPEEDESVGDSSNFEDKAEKFAGVIGDIELEYLVNLSGGQFEILKGFLQDEMGYRDLGQYKRN
tara:strand:- start:19 stop:699 length:681 start_codon:yes stop_codon:yes gene_type:complete